MVRLVCTYVPIYDINNNNNRPNVQYQANERKGKSKELNNDGKKRILQKNQQQQQPKKREREKHTEEWKVMTEKKMK